MNSIPERCRHKTADLPLFFRIRTIRILTSLRTVCSAPVQTAVYGNQSVLTKKSLLIKRKYDIVQYRLCPDRLPAGPVCLRIHYL